MVKLLLKHKPDANLVDTFGKKVYERAKTSEIAALIQSYAFSSQFAKTVYTTKGSQGFFAVTARETVNAASKSVGRGSVRTPEKSPTRATPVSHGQGVGKDGLSTAVKKELNKLAEGSGRERVNEIIKLYLSKMKGKMNKALTSKLQSELATQLTSTEAELRKCLGDDFSKGSTQTLNCAMQLFNLRMEQTLKKHGVEVQPEMLLGSGDITGILNSGDVYCGYTEPNATIIDTLKLLSKTPIKPKRRALSPMAASQPFNEDSDLGICVMTFIGSQLERLSNDLMSELSAKLGDDLARALELMKATYLASNHTSFERLGREIEQKVSSTFNDRFTRITKNIKDRYRKSEIERKVLTTTSLREGRERSEDAMSERLEPDLMDKLKSARLSKQSGTIPFITAS